jgi:molecular chaperone GrpE (heat shock protein)
MGAYAYRIGEMRDLLAQVPAAANDTINQNFADLVNRYAELRQSAMNDLVDFMAKASAGNLGTQSKWQSRIARLRSDYQDLFRMAANDVMLPPAHQLFWATALDAEERFFDALSRVVTPQRMDDLLQHQDNLSKLFGALQDTWTFLLSETDRAKTDEMRIVQDLDKMVQEILSEMDDYWTKTKEYYEKVSDSIAREIDYLKTALKDMLGKLYDAGVALVELAKALFIDQKVKPDGTPPEIDAPVVVVLQQMKLAADAAAEGARKYREMIKSYQDLVIRQKGGVLTMFNKTRQDVDQYLRSNGIGQAQTYLDQAKADLNNWISGLPTGRQRDDGTAFRDDISQKLDIVFKRTKDLDDQFKAKFQGALLSPLSNETIETMAQHYLFKEQFDKIKDRDLPEKLQDIQEELPERVIKIDDKLRELVESVSSTDGLPDEVRNVAREMTEEFRAYLRDRIKTQIDILLPIIDELKRLMIPSNLDQDLNREELESMLN